MIHGSIDSDLTIGMISTSIISSINSLNSNWGYRNILSRGMEEKEIKKKRKKLEI
jgi:hypothetical protein